MKKINKLNIRYHNKASEKYIDVEFFYDEVIFKTSIPIEYRRTGTDIQEDQIDNYLLNVYENINPRNWANWKLEQVSFWSNKSNATVTKEFYDKLALNFEWCCVNCTLPKNPNWARRIQDLKEFGYTLATQTNQLCVKCNLKTTQIILIPLNRGGITGYEVWSDELRNKIISVLQIFDSFEAKSSRKEGLLPDHKFPEIRWDHNTKRTSLEKLSDSEIKKDFQLLTNQRNQQKREVCRKCFQTGKRGTVYGILFYYRGTEEWDTSIPKSGKDAEYGCIGCGWYDINEWRKQLNIKIK